MLGDYTEEAAAAIREIVGNISFPTHRAVARGGRVWIGVAQLRDAMHASQDLALQSFFLQYWLQEEKEQDFRRTVVKNRRGFMSSHARTATRVAQAILGGEIPEPPEGGFRADGIRFTDAIAYAAHVGARYAASTLAVIQEVVQENDPPRQRFSLADLLGRKPAEETTE